MSQIKIELPSNLTIQQAKHLVAKVESLVESYQSPQKSSGKKSTVETDLYFGDRSGGCHGGGFGGFDRGFGGKDRGGFRI